MIQGLLNAIQGLAEYSALNGGEVAGGTGAHRLTTWAADHRVALAALVAGLAFVWLVRSATRR